jgi:hypothetical protein
MVLAPGTRAAGGAHLHANPARTYGERTNRALLASENHGHPAIAATSKSGEFTARQVPVKSTSHCATKSKFAIPLMHVRSYIFSEGLHGAPKDTREKRWRMICDSGCFGTSSVVRWRLSKGHRPFRYLPPIKFLYLRYLWLCAFRIASPIPIRAPAQRFWSIFSERPRPLNHLHRRALERIPDALFGGN